MKSGQDERWSDVPGYDGRYQASTLGGIRRVNPDGTYLILKPFIRKSGKNIRSYKVWLTAPNGRRTEKGVLRLVAETWNPPPPGYIVIHRNSMFSDNSVYNIRHVQPCELARIYAGTKNRRPVVKLDRHGNIVECYTSASAAAKANYVNISTVCKQCNGDVKQPRILDGGMFRWDDDCMLRGGELHFILPSVVCKVDGRRIICHYQTVKDAAADNHVSRTLVYSHCNGSTKHSKKLGSITFRWGIDAKPRKGGRKSGCD